MYFCKLPPRSFKVAYRQTTCPRPHHVCQPLPFTPGPELRTVLFPSAPLGSALLCLQPPLQATQPSLKMAAHLRSLPLPPPLGPITATSSNGSPRKAVRECVCLKRPREYLRGRDGGTEGRGWGVGPVLSHPTGPASVLTLSRPRGAVNSRLLV